MNDTGGMDAALTRLEAALERLESAAKTMPASDDDTMARIEAERDLMQLKHRRLLRDTEAALADLDRLLVQAETG